MLITRKTLGAADISSGNIKGRRDVTMVANRTARQSATFGLIDIKLLQKGKAE